MRMMGNSNAVLLKLRNRLLALIMIISSAVLVTSFVSVYVLTMLKVDSDNSEKLNFYEELAISTKNIIESEGELTYGGLTGEVIVVNRVFPDNGVQFNLIMNAEGELLMIDSPLGLPAENYQAVADEAFKRQDGIIDFEGRKWRYQVTGQNIILTIQPYQSELSAADDMYLIRLLDVTDSLSMLETLRMTLASIGLLLLVTLYFLSRFFADRAVRPLTEAWEKQSQFITDASHELKTPLSIINANIGVLHENKDETVESQRKWLGYIESGIERMSILINHLLLLAKMEDYKLQPENMEINLSELVADAVEDISAAAAAKGIVIKEILPEEFIFKTDYTMQRQVLDILLDNAIKYAPENGIVEVELRQSKSHALLSVRNSGEGIPPEELPKIFDRFYRTDKTRGHESGSYGLGLSIADSVVKKLGGKITVESEIKGMTVFTFSFKLH